MADFLLDLSARPRSLNGVAEALRFSDDTQVASVEDPRFNLVVTYTGDAATWAPFTAEDGTRVAVVGRAAFDEAEWSEAGEGGGAGGLAARIIYRRFAAGGETALDKTNGNCVVLLVEVGRPVIHLVTDCSGVFPTFECFRPPVCVYGSHPDVVARVAGREHDLDTVSMGEFILSGTLTPPHTYYRGVRFTGHAVHLRFLLAEDGLKEPRRRTYFDFTYLGDVHAKESDLAVELADAIRHSVRRRTLPRLGTTAVALSGGLDSRIVLSCVADRNAAFAFTCYDAPNLELHTARRIAEANGTRFVPVHREFDYYGSTAERGVRISGGMGSLANNHFLGAVDRLRAEGMSNLLTGCYCDYLFKALPLNRHVNRFSGRETLAPFRHEFYFSHRTADTAVAQAVRERWESRIPPGLQKQESASDVFQIEYLRTFPLCYEGDCQQRLVPQRVAGWALPMADRAILDVYRRVPYSFKLNRSIFSRVALLLCGTRVAHVPDTNTGAQLDAANWHKWAASRWMKVRRRLRRRQTIGTDESWPDWRYYVTHSQVIRALWERPNPDAMDFFREVMGRQAIATQIEAYEDQRLYLFLTLLTLKIWMDQRGC